MTKTDAFNEINQIQERYIDELISLMNNPDYTSMKSINFTSATGTGKTKMMSKLMNRLPDYYFIVTTLSKGQLHLQIKDNLCKDCNQNNFDVYGSADYRINSKLQAKDIISRIPNGKKCIWLRDEGHIRTNRFDELLLNACFKVVNFSATNIHSDIHCSFAQTMMLRTVNQTTGTPEDAIGKLYDVKIAHSNVPNYNPCAIFRCVGGDDALYNRIVKLCDDYGFKYINVTDDEFVMQELCEDDNEYDVIINKFKIVEGIDIRRAHVLYMDNKPSNNATTIQVIGRCRRNALLYRDDIDILSPENDYLLKRTRECYVYYNVDKMKIDTDEYGELQYAFCNHISCEELKSGTFIDVVDGQLKNGLYVIELEGQTGRFEILKDDKTGFNMINPKCSFYNEHVLYHNQYFYVGDKKIKRENVKLLPKYSQTELFSYKTGNFEHVECPPYYILTPIVDLKECLTYNIDKNVIDYFESCMNNITIDMLKKMITPYDVEINIDCISLQEYIIAQNEKYKHIYDLDNVDYFMAFDISLDSYLDTNNMLLFKQHMIKCLQLLDSKDIPLWNKVNRIVNSIKSFCIYCFKFDADKASNYDVANFIIWFWNVTIEQNMNIDTCSVNEYLAKNIHVHQFLIKSDDFKNDGITMDHISSYFVLLASDVRRLIFPRIGIDYVANYIVKHMKYIFKCLQQKNNNNVLKNVVNQISCVGDNKAGIYISYNDLFEEIGENEDKPATHGLGSKIAESLVINNDRYIPYTKITNDKESAIIGVDLMHQVRNNKSVGWIESKSVSSKICINTKFNVFLTNKYSDELNVAKKQYFNGKNTFDLDAKCNSVIGYCVEYYSKYLLYGPDVFGYEYLDAAICESNGNCLVSGMIENLREHPMYLFGRDRQSIDKLVNNNLIVRACMLKYRDMMIRSFGEGVSRVIKGISVIKLVQDKYREFVELVVELGTRTAEYVRRELYPDGNIKDNIDPNLSINHITGLVDYITEDTILDVKVRNNIDERCVRQVLAYHYLSTKRSDLHIERVIVYDAVSDNAVVINISDKNIVK